MAPPLISRDEVHQALEVLYDNVQLAECSLTHRFPQLEGITRLEERADRARALLLEGIEVLRPGRAVAFGSPESRFYDLLTLRYVENLTLPQAMDELSLSRRQVYRDLADAEGRLVQVLESWVGPPTDEAGSRRQSLVSEELASLPDACGQTDLETVLREAVALVQGLADRLQVRIALPEPGAGAMPMVLADRSMLKQVLVQLLSAGLQSRPVGPLRVELAHSESMCNVSLLFTPAPDGLKQEMLDTAWLLASSQRISHTAERRDDGTMTVSLGVSCKGLATVLVVEDNPGAIELYRRYLTGSRWQVMPVPNPLLTFEMARRSRPYAVILDILMPGLDGWSIIKVLREHEDTRDIRLLVCSVLEDPSLASSLGADVYLSKPVSRAQLLQALAAGSPLRPNE